MSVSIKQKMSADRPEAKLFGILEESGDEGRDLTEELHGSGEGRSSRQQQQIPTVLQIDIERYAAGASFFVKDIYWPNSTYFLRIVGGK